MRHPIRIADSVDPEVATVFSISLDPERPGAAPNIALSLRRAGDMTFHDGNGAARSRFLERLGLRGDRVARLRQTHSRTVWTVAEDWVQGVEGDGLVTQGREWCLSVTVADCLPIFLFDPVNQIHAVVHSGWRGTGIVRDALEHMESGLGTKASNVRVVLGPGIGPCCYDVPEERAARFREAWGDDTVQRREGRSYLDLAAANAGLLERAGVRDITIVEECASCSAFLGSYRREGAASFTRMLAVIGYFR